MKQQHF